MRASDPLRLRSKATAIAFAVAPVSSSALTLTAPLPVSVTPEPTEAVFVPLIQFTETPAATPTPPPWLPDWLLAWPLPWLAESLDFGRSPPVLPFEFGLFLTWSFDCVSACLPPSESCDSPFALALVMTSFRDEWSRRS